MRFRRESKVYRAVQGSCFDNPILRSPRASRARALPLSGPAIAAQCLNATYAAVVDTLKEADTHAAEELAARREAISNTTIPYRVEALAQAYAAVAKWARPATARVQDIAVLLEKIRDLRSANQSQACVVATPAALR